MIGLVQKTPLRLGETSVRQYRNGAFSMLACGQGFWRVSHSHVEGQGHDYELHRVWITDQNNVSHLYPTASLSNVVIY